MARKNAKEVPINGYDDLSVGEVEKKIKGLSKDEIEAIRSYEKNTKNRKTLLENIEGNAQSVDLASVGRPKWAENRRSEWPGG